MLFLNIGNNPVNEVIFERPLDELVKEVETDQFVDIRSWEVVREGLKRQLGRHSGRLAIAILTTTCSLIPNSSQSRLPSKIPTSASVSASVRRPPSPSRSEA